MNRNEFFQAMPITRLSIRLTTAALEICTADIEDIHVMVSGSKEASAPLHITAAADTLRVEQPLHLHAGGWLQVTIRLPRSWRGAITARTTSGWMNLSALSGTDLTLATVSGAIKAVSLTFMTCRFCTLTGAVTLSQIMCKEARLASLSGSISAAEAQLQHAQALTLTGDIILALRTPFEAMSLASLTGELAVDAPINLCDAALRSLSGKLHATGVSVVEGGPKLRACTLVSTLDISTTLE